MAQYREALKRHFMALVLDQQKHGENHSDVATSYNSIGLVYENLGEPEKALEFYQKALNIRLQVYGKNHPNVQSVLKSLITCAGQASSAQIKTLQEISILCRKVLGEQDLLVHQLNLLIAKKL